MLSSYLSALRIPLAPSPLLFFQLSPSIGPFLKPRGSHDTDASYDNQPAEHSLANGVGISEVVGELAKIIENSRTSALPRPANIVRSSHFNSQDGSRCEMITLSGTKYVSRVPRCASDMLGLR